MPYSQWTFCLFTALRQCAKIALVNAKTAESTPFQKFSEIARAIMSVPKSELDKREKLYRKQRERENSKKL